MYGSDNERVIIDGTPDTVTLYHGSPHANKFGYSLDTPVEHPVDDVLSTTEAIEERSSSSAQHANAADGDSGDDSDLDEAMAWLSAEEPEFTIWAELDSLCASVLTSLEEKDRSLAAKLESIAQPTTNTVIAVPAIRSSRWGCCMPCSKDISSDFVDVPIMSTNPHLFKLTAMQSHGGDSVRIHMSKIQKSLGHAKYLVHNNVDRMKAECRKLLRKQQRQADQKLKEMQSNMATACTDEPIILDMPVEDVASTPARNTYAGRPESDVPPASPQEPEVTSPEPHNYADTLQRLMQQVKALQDNSAQEFAVIKSSLSSPKPADAPLTLSMEQQGARETCLQEEIDVARQEVTKLQLELAGLTTAKEERDAAQLQLQVSQARILELQASLQSQREEHEAELASFHKWSREHLANAREVIQLERQAINTRYEALKQEFTDGMTALKSQCAACVDQCMCSVRESTAAAQAAGKEEAAAACTLEVLTLKQVHDGVIAQLQQHCDRMQAEGNAAREALEASTTLAHTNQAEVERLQIHIASLEREARDRHINMQDLQLAHSRAQEECAGLQENIRKLTAANADLTSSNAGLQSQVTVANVSIQSLRGDNASLQSEAVDAWANITAADTRILDLTYELQQLQAAKQALGERGVSLETQLSSANEALEARNAEVSELRATLEAATERIHSQEAFIAQLNTEAERMNEALKAQEAQTQQLQSQLTAMQEGDVRRAQEENARMGKQIKQLTAANDTLKDTKTSLETQLNVAASALARCRGDNDSMRGQVDGQKADITRWEGEVQRLTAALAACETQAQEHELQLEALHEASRKQREDQEDVNAMLEGRVVQLTAANSELEIIKQWLHQHLDAATASLKSLKEECEANQHKQIQQLTDIKAAHAAQVQKLESQLSALHASLLNSENGQSQLLSKVKQLTSANNDLDDRNTSLQSSLNIMTASMESMRKENNALRVEIHQQTTQLMQLAPQLQAVTQHATTLEKKLVSLRDSEALVQLQLQATQSELQGVIQARETEAEQLKQLQHAHSELQTKTQEQARMIVALQSSIDDVTASLQEQMTVSEVQVQQLQSQTSNLQSQASTLQEQLDDSSSGHAVLQSVHAKLMGEYAFLHTRYNTLSAAAATRQAETTSQIKGLLSMCAVLRAELLDLRCQMTDCRSEMSDNTRPASALLRRLCGPSLSRVLPPLQGQVQALRALLEEHKQATRASLEGLQKETADSIRDAASGIALQINNHISNTINNHTNNNNDKTGSRSVTSPRSATGLRSSSLYNVPNPFTESHLLSSAEAKRQHFLDIGQQAGCDTRLLMATDSNKKLPSTASGTPLASPAAAPPPPPADTHEEDMQVLLGQLSEQAALLYLSKQMMTADQLAKLEASEAVLKGQQAHTPMLGSGKVEGDGDSGSAAVRTPKEKEQDDDMQLLLHLSEHAALLHVSRSIMTPKQIDKLHEEALLMHMDFAASQPPVVAVLSFDDIEVGPES